MDLTEADSEVEEVDSEGRGGYDRGGYDRDNFNDRGGSYDRERSPTRFNLHQLRIKYV